MKHVTYPIESESGIATIFIRAYTTATVAYLLAAHPGALVRNWTAADDALYGTPQTTPQLSSSAQPVAATNRTAAREERRPARVEYGN